VILCVLEFGFCLMAGFEAVNIRCSSMSSWFLKVVNKRMVVNYGRLENT